MEPVITKSTSALAALADRFDNLATEKSVSEKLENNLGKTAQIDQNRFAVTLDDNAFDDDADAWDNETNDWDN